MASLFKTGEYSDGTRERYVTARSHVAEFIKYKYEREDLSFAALNYKFVKNYELYLKTIRKCSNNTSLKYISNLKRLFSERLQKKL
ncbi:MAG: phage integrase SAM-like domain-containing protein [Sphingobacterium sp.]